MLANSNRRRLTPRSFLATALLFSLIISSPFVTMALSSTSEDATVTVDASKVVGKISPLLYGQFIEFMFEGVKGGLHAELLRNRSFEEPSNAIGLSCDWERYPDDRDDDYGLSFLWDESLSYAANHEPPKREHSLRVDAGDGVIQRHGVYQGRVPVRAGIDYHGYLWAKTEGAPGYQGRISVALEPEVPGQQP